MKFWKIIISENKTEKTIRLAAPKTLNKPDVKKVLKQVHPEWGKFRMLRDKSPKDWVLFKDEYYENKRLKKE